MVAETFLAKELCVVYASDDRYAEVMGVSLLSLLQNNRDFERIRVYILDAGISWENRERVEFICRKANCAPPRWLPGKNIIRELSMDVTLDRGSVSQYERLFVGSALPNHLHRVLYLDCDTLILGSIRELWEMDLQGKTVGALNDAFSQGYRKCLNLPPNGVMFNSGVMVIDLDRWRRVYTEEKLLRFIREKNGWVLQGDQGALNAVLSFDAVSIAAQYNALSIFFDFTYAELLRYRKPPAFYPKDAVQNAADHPVIVHFTSSFLSRRPWQTGCKHRYVDAWLGYREKTPWGSFPLWEYMRPKGLRGAYMALAPHLPRRCMIWLSALLQAYGRPWHYRFISMIKGRREA